MMDSSSVITTATQGIVEGLRKEYEVSTARIYQILGEDCSYPKTKKLIRRITRLSQSGGRLIKADLDAMWAEILQREGTGRLTAADLHKEAFEAIQALLEDKSDVDKKRELRELIATASLMLGDEG